MNLIIRALSFIIIFWNTNLAQLTASATATGTYAQLGYSTATKLADLNFGTIYVGTSIAVEPKSAQAAEVMFNGSSSTAVNVTITFPTVLNNGPNTINFQNSKSNPVYNTIPDASSAVEFKHKDGGTASTGPDGNLYIWMGGKVTATRPIAAGVYTGIIQVVVVQP